MPSKRIEPEVGSISRSSVRQSVDLPQPGLADQAQRLALVDEEADVVDRPHLADLAVDQDPAS